MKLTINPHSVISRFVLSIVKHSMTVNRIVLKFSLIESTILKKQLSLSMLHSVESFPFIFMPLCINYSLYRQHLFGLTLFERILGFLA